MPYTYKTTFTELTLNNWQAHALAELCKRLSLDGARELSANIPQAYDMLAACNLLAELLAREGFDGR